MAIRFTAPVRPICIFSLLLASSALTAPAVFADTVAAVHDGRPTADAHTLDQAAASILG